MIKRLVANPWKMALFAIVMGSLVYNTFGVTWGLPVLWYPDEPETLENIVIPMARNFDLNPHIFHKGSLYYYFLLLVLSPYFVLVKLLHLPTEDYEALVGRIALLARIATACVGAAGTILMHRVGKRLGGNGAGLMAAFLLAVNVAYASYAHYAYMEVPTVVLLLVTLVFALRYVETFRGRDLFLSAFCGGLAVSAKYNAAVMVLPLLLILNWVRISRPGAETRSPRLVRAFLSREFLVSLALVAFAFLLTTPFAVLDFRTFLSYMIKQSFISREGYKVFVGSRSWGGNFSLLGVSFGLPLFILVLVSYGSTLLFWLRTPDAKNALVLVPPLFYFAYIGTWRITAVRYVLPLVPFLVPAVPLAIARLKAFRPAPRFAVWGIAGLTMAFSAYQSFLGVRCFTTDTRFEAERWIRGHMGPGSKVEMYAYKMYLPRLPGGLDSYRLIPNFVSESAGFREFEASDLGKRLLGNAERVDTVQDNRSAFSGAELRQRNPDYIVLSSFYDDRYLPTPSNKTAVLYPELGRYYEALVSGCSGYERAVVFQDNRMQEFYLNPTITVLRRSARPAATRISNRRGGFFIPRFEGGILKGPVQ